MPSFEFWWFLLLLPLAPWPALLRLNRPRMRVVLPMAPTVSPEEERKPASYWWWTGCIAALLVALAGPQPARSPSTGGGTMVVVLDASGSMEDPLRPGEAKGPTRWSAASDAVTQVLDHLAKLPRYRSWDTGLVLFARQPTWVLPTGTPADALASTLAGLGPTRTPGETSTHLGDALTAGLEAFEGAPAGDQRRRVLLLVTDGEHNAQPTGEPGDFTPRQAAQFAGGLEARLAILRVANTQSPEPTRQAAGQLLDDLADRTGGMVLSVPLEAEAATKLLETLGAPSAGFWESIWNGPWRALLTVGSLGCAIGALLRERREEGGWNRPRGR
jgi:Mg-chelatase subunit ChlD